MHVQVILDSLDWGLSLSLLLPGFIPYVRRESDGWPKEHYKFYSRFRSHHRKCLRLATRNPITNRFSEENSLLLWQSLMPRWWPQIAHKMIGHLFDTIVLASSDKPWNYLWYSRRWKPSHLHKKVRCCYPEGISYNKDGGAREKHPKRYQNIAFWERLEYFFIPRR